jgi:hypothetical protein
MKMTNQKNAEKCQIFVCEICDFTCCKESNYKKHIETMKHKRLTETNKKMPNQESKSFVCNCGNKYNHKSSLAKHKRTCIEVNASIETNKPVLEIKETEMYKQMHEQIDSKTDKELKDLVKDLIKQNSELVKTINEIVPKIGTTNNITNNNTNFNLNVFLNEKCKDALNINDFIESLKITLEDLDFSNKNGMVQGISNLMIKGLKELDIHKRPIHCTDAKRDIIYIKDKEKWEKDDNHSKIKNTIIKVANKERNSLYLWVDKNPHWFDSEDTQIEYLTMMRNICEPVEDFEKNEKKIIKNIGREVTLDKCTM